MGAVRDRAAAEVVALDRALEALSDRDPRHLHLVAGRERLDGDGLADLELALAAELDEVAVRGDARLRQVALLALRDLPLGNGVEGDLDRLVAVGLHRLHLHDRARAGLDHGHGRHPAALRIEDLRHAQLSAEDALH
jgi:hypothetical protein